MILLNLKQFSIFFFIVDQVLVSHNPIFAGLLLFHDRLLDHQLYLGSKIKKYFLKILIV
jgi:hypothetical protein